MSIAMRTFSACLCAQICYDYSAQTNEVPNCLSTCRHFRHGSGKKKIRSLLLFPDKILRLFTPTGSNKHIFPIFSDGVQLPMVSLVFVHQKLINGVPPDNFSSTSF